MTSDDGKSPWLYVYADILRDELPKRGVALNAVDNEGIGGNRTDQALARLTNDVLSKSPDWVVVQFGINDSWWHAGEPANSDDPDSSGSRIALNALAQSGGDGVFGNGNDHPHADQGNYADNLTQIVRRLRADDIRVVLMTPNQTYDDQSAVWRNQLLSQYAQVVRDIAAAEDVPLIDVWKLYEVHASKPGNSIRDLLLDPVHPNAAGHRLIANALMDQVPWREAQDRTAPAGNGKAE